MSFEFLSPDRTRPHVGEAPVARSPVDALLERAGARFEVRDGWRIATHFGSVDGELELARSRVAVGDRSELAKLELQAPGETVAEVVAGTAEGARLEPGRAARSGEAWWCPVTPERALVLAPPAEASELRDRLEREVAASPDSLLVDVTAGLCALAVVGPEARELLARLTALDTRPSQLPDRGFQPISVARVPAMVLREGGDRFLVLCGSAQAHYMWTAATDAGEPLGGGLLGADARERLAAGEEAVRA